MKIFRFVCISALVLGMATAAFAAETSRTARITSLDGSAEVKPAGQSSWSAVQSGAVLNEGDTLKTGAKSMAILDIGDKGEVGTVEVSEGSQLLLSDMTFDKKSDTSRTLLDLAMGEVLIKAQKVHGEGSKFEVKTPTSIVGVRGTTFKVKVESMEE
jgi:hypothetical protein